LDQTSIVGNQVQLQLQFGKGNQVKGQPIRAEDRESLAQGFHDCPDFPVARHLWMESRLMKLLDSGLLRVTKPRSAPNERPDPRAPALPVLPDRGRMGGWPGFR